MEAATPVPRLGPNPRSPRGAMSTGIRRRAKRRSSLPANNPMQDCKSPTGLETTSDAANRIMVYVRLRPLSEKETEKGEVQCVKVVNDRHVYLLEPCDEKDYLRAKRTKAKQYAFDKAFTETSTQEDVYFSSTSSLVDSVLESKNASVFCYGATGAGKTYTMLGTPSSPGVMVLAISDLFVKLAQKSVAGDFSVKLSYLEVYNETVHDLLVEGRGRPLLVRSDSNLETNIAGLSQVRASSAREVVELLQHGNGNRTTESTRSNETSSRSHAILQVFVEYHATSSSGDAAGAAPVKRTGKLSLIDLAGSERALATEARTQRSKEGAHINKSLLALSSCIRALVEGHSHVPYRDSKLTQLLKDSLGGGCETAMIANIAPQYSVQGETANTLHWADRAKEIRHRSEIEFEPLTLTLPPRPSDVAFEARTIRSLISPRSLPLPANHSVLLAEKARENELLRRQLAELQHMLGTHNGVSRLLTRKPGMCSATNGVLAVNKGFAPLHEDRAGSPRQRWEVLQKNGDGGRGRSGLGLPPKSSFRKTKAKKGRERGGKEGLLEVASEAGIHCQREEGIGSTVEDTISEMEVENAAVEKEDRMDTDLIQSLLFPAADDEMAEVDELTWAVKDLRREAEEKDKKIASLEARLRLKDSYIQKLTLGWKGEKENLGGGRGTGNEGGGGDGGTSLRGSGQWASGGASLRGFPGEVGPNDEAQTPRGVLGVRGGEEGRNLLRRSCEGRRYSLRVTVEGGKAEEHEGMGLARSPVGKRPLREITVGGRSPPKARVRLSDGGAMTSLLRQPSKAHVR